MMLRRLLRREGGVSAVEFALLSPVLVLAALGTADTGMALYEKMMMNQVLRAGAEVGILGKKESIVRQVLEEAASDNFTLAGETTQPGDLTLNVDSYCVCPADGPSPTSCTTLCTSGEQSNRFYRLTASKTFAGVLLPEIAMSSALDVVVE